MPNKTFLLVDSAVLPAVYSRVLLAKKMLSTGQAKSAAEASRLSGISRGAFYKYKDSVFEYHDRSSSRTVTIHCVLQDTAGVLSQLISELYKAGANILTINQGLPVGGAASVSVSFRTSMLSGSFDEMMDLLRGLDGVRSVELLDEKT